MAEKWRLRLLTMAAWTLASLCVTFWSLKFIGSNGKMAVASIEPPAVASDPVGMARIFGPPRPPPPAPVAAASSPRVIDPSTRFALLGVVAGRANDGLALIAVDGKTARPYPVGSQIEDNYRLKSVAARSATLAPTAPGGVPFTLELAPLNNAIAPTPARLPSAAPAVAPGPTRAPVVAPAAAGLPPGLPSSPRPAG